jgi:anti-sigma factor RsiW
MKSEPHVTALDLDLLVLGQAAPEQVARIEAHSAACPSCAARRAEHGKDVQHFRMSVFPRTAGNLLTRRRPGIARRWMLGLALPLAASVLLLARSHRTNKHSAAVLDPPHAQGAIGIKGPSVVRVFARRNAADTADVTKLNDGDRLAAGDALRFVLSPTGLPYVLIASVDGAGQVNVYYPFHGEASIEVDPKGTVSVPGSIVLDKAPGPERIFVIHSNRPVLAQTVREALAEVAAGGAGMIRGVQRLPIKDTVQSTLFFEKEESR